MSGGKRSAELLNVVLNDGGRMITDGYLVFDFGTFHFYFCKALFFFYSTILCRFVLIPQFFFFSFFSFFTLFHSCNV